MIAPKIAAGAGGTVVALAGGPMLGAHTDVLMLACIGALIGLAFTKPDVWAGLAPVESSPVLVRLARFLSRAVSLSLLVAGAALISAWLAEHVVPLAAARFGYEWVADIQPRILAGLFAAAGPTVVPVLWGFAKRWLSVKGGAA